jgi:hypothetical protein
VAELVEQFGALALGEAGDSFGVCDPAAAEETVGLGGS